MSRFIGLSESDKRPVEIAAQLRGKRFQEELEAHLLHGFVFSTPDAFLMGRPVPKGADVSDVWRVWPREECSAWFVWVGVGDASKLLAMMPYHLPWIGWNRQGRGWQQNHWIKTERLSSFSSVPMLRQYLHLSLLHTSDLLSPHQRVQASSPRMKG